jgi:hypothetical protein
MEITIMDKTDTEAMERAKSHERKLQFGAHFDPYTDAQNPGKIAAYKYWSYGFDSGYAAALEAGKAVDEKPEPDAMSTEDHINEIRSARKLTLADYGLVIHND